MRTIRVAGAALLLCLTALALAALLVFRNRNRIAEFALTAIHDRTGLDVHIKGTRVGIGRRLEVVLEQPSVTVNGQEVAHLQDIRAVLTYRSILHRGGLPLYRLLLNHPRVTLPGKSADLIQGVWPRNNVAVINTLRRGLEAYAGIAQQLEVVDGTVTDADHTAVIDSMGLQARRAHRRSSDSPWLIDFAGRWQGQLGAGVQVGGSFAVGPRPVHPELMANGRLWLRGLQMERHQFGTLEVSGGLDGLLRVAVEKSGMLRGNADLNLRELMLRGNVLADALKPGNYQVSASYQAVPDRIEVADLTVRRDRSSLVTGHLDIAHPWAANPSEELSAGGVNLAFGRAAAWLYTILNLPAGVRPYVARVDAGNLSIKQISLVTNQPLRDWNLATLRDDLRATGTIHDAALTFPSNLQLPLLRHFDAEIKYASGQLSISAGSFVAGRSQFNDVAAELDLRTAPTRLPYALRVKGNLALDEMYPAVAEALRKASPGIAKDLTKLDGRAPLTLKASGDLNYRQQKNPNDYRVTIELDGVSGVSDRLAHPVVLAGGTLSLSPGGAVIDHVRILPDGPQGGYAILNGTIERADQLRLKGLTIELHDLAVARWLAFFVQPAIVSADGRFGGVLAVNGDLASGQVPRLVGKLVAGGGSLSFSFLRSPIIARAATLTLDGKGLVLALPGSMIEGAPLDFSLALDDFAHPAIRIKARAARLDLAVMRFIQPPWPPVTRLLFPTPISGHIEAFEATFDQTEMSNLAFAFNDDQDGWHVGNGAAGAYGGTIAVDLAGRGNDRWVHLVGRLEGLDAGALLRALSNGQDSPLLGKLSVTGDLWANTDVNLFDTLAGNASIRIDNGTLLRFKLLTQLLSFIDLKNWVTAQIPDPRVAGIPFKTLSASFKGADGAFYTDDLRLAGPVIDITAHGDLRFGQGLLDLEVGLIPFNTANWILNQIPLVGDNLAGGSKGLVAAYFQVQGPLHDPQIKPMPITSIIEFVKKTLGLPINIIAPNTIR